MNDQNPRLLSVIIPAYNEQEMIETTFFTLKNILDEASVPFELIFVDDGSSDGTYHVIELLSQTNKEVTGLSFSKNFGKEAAIFAGLTAASGACAAVMDCDLQHPPETLVPMYQLWEQGYEVIEGVKSSRGRENPFYAAGARLFYLFISRATGIDMSRASDYKLLDRRAVDALLDMPERTPFFRALSSWIGFKTVAVPFEVQERRLGKSKWSARSLTKYAVRNITSFSGAPLQFVTFIGWIMFIFATVMGAQSVVRFLSGNAQEGFTTVILLLLIIGSLVMISLGIIGHYLARIYDEIKARPRFIIRRRCGKTVDNLPDDILR